MTQPPQGTGDLEWGPCAYAAQVSRNWFVSLLVLLWSIAVWWFSFRSMLAHCAVDARDGDAGQPARATDSHTHTNVFR